MERLSRWSGLALLAACPLIVISAFLHPSRETTTSIIASESRLVFAHTLFTLHGLLVLLGLPGFYQAQRGSMGRLGTAGYLGAFFGTYLIAVSGSFGFFAPVMARKAPATLDAVIQYPPVVGLSGLAAMGFTVGYVLLGIAMTRTKMLPRLPGVLVLVAVGAPCYLLGFGVSQVISTAACPVAVRGSVRCRSRHLRLRARGDRRWTTGTRLDSLH
jgi:hypothetical protein